jgi:hypothetical protein
VEEALGELAGLDFASMGEEDLAAAVVGLQGLRGRLEVTEARAVRAFDDAGAWLADGARLASHGVVEVKG